MKKIELPNFFERIIGVTLPIEARMHAVDHNEVYEIDLVSSETRITGQNPYDFQATNMTLGVNDEAKPITESNGNTVSYTFDEMADFVTVEVKISGNQNSIRFPIDSGDWFFGSFSTCGTYLVLAAPYELWVFLV